MNQLSTVTIFPIISTKLQPHSGKLPNKLCLHISSFFKINDTMGSIKQRVAKHVTCHFDSLKCSVYLLKLWMPTVQHAQTQPVSWYCHHHPTTSAMLFSVAASRESFLRSAMILRPPVGRTNSLRTQKQQQCVPPQLSLKQPTGYHLSRTPPQADLPPHLSIKTTRSSLIHHPDTECSPFDCTGCPFLTVCR